jgi:hypothetical protein
VTRFVIPARSIAGCSGARIAPGVAAKRAAEAVSDRGKSWDEVFAIVGMIGLIAFAVAAVLDGREVKVPNPTAG